MGKKAPVRKVIEIEGEEIEREIESEKGGETGRILKAGRLEEEKENFQKPPPTHPLFQPFSFPGGVRACAWCVQ